MSSRSGGVSGRLISGVAILIALGLVGTLLTEIYKILLPKWLLGFAVTGVTKLASLLQAVWPALAALAILALIWWLVKR